MRRFIGSASIYLLLLDKVSTDKYHILTDSSCKDEADDEIINEVASESEESGEDNDDQSSSEDSESVVDEPFNPFEADSAEEGKH